jgi:hypothetical protein
MDPLSELPSEPGPELPTYAEFSPSSECVRAKGVSLSRIVSISNKHYGIFRTSIRNPFIVRCS